VIWRICVFVIRDCHLNDVFFASHSVGTETTKRVNINLCLLSTLLFILFNLRVCAIGYVT